MTPALHDGALTVYTRAGDVPLIVLLLGAIGEAAWRRRRARA